MQRRVDVQHHRAGAGRRGRCGATPRRGPRPSPPTGPPSVAGSIWRNVRYSVESDATDPNKRAWARRCSMSAHASPPPASINIAWVNTLPRSCNGKRSPAIGMRADSESPSPSRSAKRAKSVQPDMGHDLVAAGFHHHRDRAVTVHLASALLARDLTSSTTSESLATRAFPRMRGPQPIKTRERSGSRRLLSNLRVVLAFWCVGAERLWACRATVIRIGSCWTRRRWWAIWCRRGRCTRSWLSIAAGCSPMRCSPICSRSGRGRPSVPADVIATVMVLQSLGGPVGS